MLSKVTNKADNGIEWTLQQTFRNSGDDPEAGGPSEIFHVEHSAFSASTHPFLGESNDSPGGGGGGGGVRSATHDRVDTVWQDAVCYNPEVASAGTEQQPGGGGSHIMEYLAHWDFCNPGKTTRKRNRNGRNVNKSRDRNRFNSKIPFHRKGDVIDDLSWTFGQAMMMGGGSGGAGNSDPAPAPAGKMGPPGAVPSPVSAGPATPLGSIMTPKGPSSVKTPGEPPNLHSQGPPSNGPLTPAAADGTGAAPRTPKSVPQYPGVASPFPNVKSVETKKVGSVKQEEPLTPAENGVQSAHADDVKQEPPSAEPSAFGKAAKKAAAVATITAPTPFKRPALPLKEYERELEREGALSDDIYDHNALQHWLNYPVKKFRPVENKRGDPFRPMYRRSSQANVFDVAAAAVHQAPQDSSSVAAAAVTNAAVDEHKVNGVDGIKEEPMEVNGIDGANRKIKADPAAAAHFNSDPYEFSDDKKDGKVRRQLWGTQDGAVTYVNGSLTC